MEQLPAEEQGNKQIEDSRPERMRRAGRGRLVSVDSWTAKGKASLLAEPDSESTVASDEFLTEIALASANSESNASIQRSNQQAADEIEHIFSGLSENNRRLLEHVLKVGPSDSLRDTAANVGAYPAQLSRAYEAATRAHKWRIFKQSRRNTAPPARAFIEYRPPVVPFERVMMTHQGPVLSYIGHDLRTNSGLSLINEARDARTAGPSPDGKHAQHGGAQVLESADATAGKVVNPFPESNGCTHPDRQWLKVGFADLRLTCLACRTEFAQVNPFVRNV
jgi:hypothetical protein